MSYTDEQHNLGEDAVSNEFTKWLDEQVYGLTPSFESFNEMGEKTGVPASAISRMRNGEKPSILNLGRFADFFHIDLADLQRMAGILPTDPELSPEEAKRQLRIKQVLNIYARLPEADQGEMMEVATIMAGLSDQGRALLVRIAKTMMEHEVA